MHILENLVIILMNTVIVWIFPEEIIEIAALIAFNQGVLIKNINCIIISTALTVLTNII